MRRAIQHGYLSGIPPHDLRHVEAILVPACNFPSYADDLAKVLVCIAKSLEIGSPYHNPEVLPCGGVFTQINQCGLARDVDGAGLAVDPSAYRRILAEVFLRMCG